MSRILRAAGALVDCIKINAISREMRDGRPLWIKQRRWTAGPIMAGANRFFRFAGNPVRAIEETAAWQRWEVDCFLQLHGEQFHAFADGPRTVAADEVPGTSLSSHLNAGTITPPMLAAAGRELRRAHHAECTAFRGPWSHGDPHSGNFIYDAGTDRARLIDFEVMHHPPFRPTSAMRMICWPCCKTWWDVFLPATGCPMRRLFSTNTAGRKLWRSCASGWSFPVACHAFGGRFARLTWARSN